MTAPQDGKGWWLAAIALGVLAAVTAGGASQTASRHPVARPAPAPRPIITHVTRVTVQHVAASPWPLSGGLLALVVIIVACCALVFVAYLPRLIQASRVTPPTEWQPAAPVSVRRRIQRAVRARHPRWP